MKILCDYCGDTGFDGDLQHCYRCPICCWCGERVSDIEADDRTQIGIIYLEDPKPLGDGTVGTDINARPCSIECFEDIYRAEHPAVKLSYAAELHVRLMRAAAIHKGLEKAYDETVFLLRDCMDAYCTPWALVEEKGGG